MIREINDDDISPEEFDNFRNELEKEFLEMVDKGMDVHEFLYVPAKVLTDEMRKRLDDFLLQEAWKNLEKSHEPFIVYTDEFSTVVLHENDKQNDILQKLITLFESKEEYEKCNRLKEISNSINL